MEIELKTKQIGGSLAIIVPKEVVKRERIKPEDTVLVRIQKVENLNTLWGSQKDIKKSTKQIMKEIDYSED